MAGVVGTRRATVVVPWSRGPSRSCLLRGPEARLGPVACYWGCAAAPRADDWQGEALQKLATMDALAGVVGCHRWPMSGGKGKVEDAIFFCSATLESGLTKLEDNLFSLFFFGGESPIFNPKLSRVSDFQPRTPKPDIMHP